MSTIMSPRHGERTAEERAGDRRLATAFLGGSSAEMIGGVGAIVLTIIGLSNVAPGFMVSISTIILGGTFLLQGGAVAAEYQEIMDRTSNGVLEKSEWGGGMSVDVLAGATGIVLGILGVIGIATQELTGAAVITFGAALMMSYGTVQGLNDLKLEMTDELEPRAKRAARQALLGAAGIQVLVGIGVIVLGILTVTDVAPMDLALVSLLITAASLVISASVVGGRFAGVFVPSMSRGRIHRTPVVEPGKPSAAAAAAARAQERRPDVP